MKHINDRDFWLWLTRAKVLLQTIFLSFKILVIGNMCRKNIKLKIHPIGIATLKKSPKLNDLSFVNFFRNRKFDFVLLKYLL